MSIHQLRKYFAEGHSNFNHGSALARKSNGQFKEYRNINGAV